MNRQDLIAENASLKSTLKEQVALFSFQKKQLTLQNEKLTERLTELTQQLEWLKKQIFGKKSEKIIDSGNEQQLCFEGFELIKQAPEEKKPVKGHTRRAPKDGQSIKIPEDLPIEKTLIDLPEEEKKDLRRIGEEITSKLAYRPGSYFIKQIIRPKYANGEEIKTADLPDSLLTRCKADESLLSHLAVQKYADHLPHYRIHQILKREGIDIPRQLLSSWVVKASLALKPLYDVMLAKILMEKNIFADETPIPMLSPGSGKTHKAYSWVICNKTLVTYHFRESRSHKHIFELLKDYQGNLHSDKYGAYEELAKNKHILWMPCYAHIRRKFFESEDSPLRSTILRKIRHLYLLEKVALSRDEKSRLKIRQEKEAPLIDEILEIAHHELTEGKHLPKSLIRKALGYLYSLKPHLKNYTTKPEARLDNNTAEQAIRPLALGRKNWLFAGSESGGEAGAILCSLIQSCKNLKKNPQRYLEDIMRRLNSHNSQKLEELLPDAWSEKNDTS